MRVISGKYKGLKLDKPINKKIRPTSDRLKEAIFSTLNSKKYSTSILETNFLDLCSGTGSIGLEAFSRGAKYVYMIDINQYAINLIKKNVKKLKLSENEKNKLIVLKGDAYKLKSLNLPVFDFIYIDAPYKNIVYNKIFSNLLEVDITKKDTLIIFETGNKIEISNKFCQIIMSKKYGSSYINFIKIKNWF